ENEVRQLMRKHMKRSSFVMWRKRVKKRRTKHSALRGFLKGRFKSYNQKN
ncbi:TIGR03643 family protein, partial [Flavobacteriales bacterium]|nr:TIGR03643 family protein [Flavobacteriales bacterium]